MQTNSTHHYKANNIIKARARYLRKKQTTAEELLWRIIRNRKIGGLKFRRQHPLANYIADFYCHELKLVIELDGDVHDISWVKERDLLREKAIKKLGIEVLRFSNEQVFSNADFIAERILEVRNSV